MIGLEQMLAALVVVSFKGFLRKTWRNTLPASSFSHPDDSSTVPWFPCIQTREMFLLWSPHCLISKSVLACTQPPSWHLTHLSSLQTSAPWHSWAHSHRTPPAVSSLSKWLHVCKGRSPKSPSAGLTSPQNSRPVCSTISYQFLCQDPTWLCSSPSQWTNP